MGKKIDLKHGKLYEISPTRLWNKKYYELNEKIILKPGEMILGQTYEKFTIPSRFAGKIITRSSYTRLGIETSCTNDFINPGYRGRVPLEIINNSKNTIVLYPLLPICQIMILPLTSVPAGTYGDERFSSKYQNEEGSPSLWWRDNLMNKIENELTALDFDTKMIELYSVKLNSVDDDCIDRFHKFIVNVKSKNMTTSENVFNKFLKQELYKNNFRKVLKGLLIGISAFFANVFYAEISKEVSSLDILLESGSITFVTLIWWIKVLLDRKQYLMEE